MYSVTLKRDTRRSHITLKFLIEIRIQVDRRIREFSIRGFSYPRLAAARKKMENYRNKRFVNLKTRAKLERAVKL